MKKLTFVIMLLFLMASIIGCAQNNQLSYCEHYHCTGKVVKTADCVTPEEIVWECNHCHYSWSEESPALGHTTDNGICERCHQPVGLSSAELKKYIVMAGIGVEIKSYRPCEYRVYIAFNNTSSKEIKYITFDVTPYDRVKEPFRADRRTLQCTGPFEPGYVGYSKRFVEGNAYYKGAKTAWLVDWEASTIEYLKLEKITIEYMDGSLLIIDDDQLIEGTFLSCTDHHIAS